MKRISLIAAALLFGGLSAAPFAAAQGGGTPDAICDRALPADDPAAREFAEPESVLEAGVDYRAVICTDAGAIYVDLLEQYAPTTVNSFVFLAGAGFYNNTTFHRVIEDFMAQGGDPTGTGTGGPGYRFEDEFVGFLTFDRPGWLAMANAGPGTNGSQFFITTVPTTHLNFRHTIFGEVLEGQQTVENLELRDPETASAPGTALNTIVIITDPSLVETAYTPPESASREAVEAAFASISNILPPDGSVVINAGGSGSFSTEEVVAGTTESLQRDFSAFLDEHNHQFRVASTLDNVTCDATQIPFFSIGYTLDAYERSDDARAAINDEFLPQIPAVAGLSAAAPTGVETIYSTTATVCEDTEATRLITFWQRGRFVITAEAVVPADTTVPAEIWLEQFVGAQIYERVIADVLRAEIRDI